MSNTTAANQFLLLFRHRDDSPDPTPAEMEQMMVKVMTWLRSLNARGELVGTNRLEDAGRVLHRHQGQVTDGPYIEAKEVIGGYVLIAARDLDAATEIARGIPFLDRIICEIRPVKPLPPL
jgi:hypothetical protein